MTDYSLLTKAQLLSIATNLKVIPSKNSGRSLGKCLLITKIMEREASPEEMMLAVTKAQQDVEKLAEPAPKEELPQPPVEIPRQEEKAETRNSFFQYSDGTIVPVVVAKRYPHGAKSYAEVIDIKRRKKKKNQKKHKMDLARRSNGWANGQNIKNVKVPAMTKLPSAWGHRQTQTSASR